METTASLCIGAVVPRTGRLARLGDPLAFVLGRLAPRLPAVGGRPVRVAVRDSRSDPVRARRAVRELAADEGAHIVLTMAGTQVLPAVADICESLRVPCVSTTFPWQAYVHRRDIDRQDHFRWTYHFAWGLDDIATVFAEMWDLLAPGGPVGCLWNDGLHGRLMRHTRHGFTAAAVARGHTLVDLGGYSEPAARFDPQVERLRRYDADIVTSAATGADLATFHRQALQAGLRPRLITSSRWLAYPHRRQAGEDLARARVGTLVYWTPAHPYRSSLDGTTAADLAWAYQHGTGHPWLQPLGLAHALVEVAWHALAGAADPTDRAAIAQALARTRLTTIAGPLDWTGGPTPNIALVPLIGGQWRPTRDGHELTVVTNTAVPEVPISADLVPAW
ncbi:ABC transporter substrate-binding protein [Spongiactinospora gelatinilytica]|uniref:ABC transporter substrate-binding protein n=1 Tax=Spongiactinospora gelatinilytica TaxID=2666298 RepID=A0A2W2GIQ1_9ACTN|nr:ABC transporter substrate-binding protein [Spongiactinospora gelatinilytica]PZG40035.1 ABC transporter substrate-binding protein [Spongiactinospora gelatinilytica]